MIVRLSPASIQGLAEIEDYIALDNSAAAARLVGRLLDAAERLAEFPELGRRIPEFPSSTLRELVQHNYRIAYRITDSEVEIVAVFESHRLLPTEPLDRDDIDDSDAS